MEIWNLYSGYWISILFGIPDVPAKISLKCPALWSNFPDGRPKMEDPRIPNWEGAGATCCYHANPLPKVDNLIYHCCITMILPFDQGRSWKYSDSWCQRVWASSYHPPLGGLHVRHQRTKLNRKCRDENHNTRTHGHNSIIPGFYAAVRWFFIKVYQNPRIPTGIHRENAQIDLEFEFRKVE